MVSEIRILIHEANQRTNGAVHMNLGTKINHIRNNTHCMTFNITRMSTHPHWHKQPQKIEVCLH